MPAVRPDWAGQFIAGGVRAARPMGRTGGPGRRRDSGGGMQWLPIGGMPARRGDGPGGNGAAGMAPGITAPGTVPPSMVPPDIVPPIGGTILGGTVSGGTVSAGAVPARHRHGFAPTRGAGAASDGRREWRRRSEARASRPAIAGRREWRRRSEARLVPGTVQPMGCTVSGRHGTGPAGGLGRRNGARQ